MPFGMARLYNLQELQRLGYLGSSESEVVEAQTLEPPWWPQCMVRLACLGLAGRVAIIGLIILQQMRRHSAHSPPSATYACGGAGASLLSALRRDDGVSLSSPHRMLRRLRSRRSNRPLLHAHHIRSADEIEPPFTPRAVQMVSHGGEDAFGYTTGGSPGDAVESERV